MSPKAKPPAAPKSGAKIPRRKPRLKIIRPDAAGLDIGARNISVCVPEGRSDQTIRTFETFTDALQSLAAWLQECGVKTVAMESTGNYWIPIHQILSEKGFEVFLVNARHVRHVPGRKSDVLDCEWIQYLHSVGLLQSSFRPAQEVCAIRSLVRHRENLVNLASQQILFMHNAFDQMNIQLHHVLSDLSGATGMLIVEAILNGERDAAKLAKLRDRRIKADEATVRRSLEGDWRAEHLLTLKFAYQSWKHFREQLLVLDEEIASLTRALESKMDPSLLPALGKPRQDQRSVNQPRQDLRSEYYRILGVDLTAIPAISVQTVQVFLSEIGPDLSRFENSDRFCSWLALCPGSKISGGKVLNSRTRHGKPRFALSLRQAALSFHRQKGALAERYRRLRAMLGAPKALTAMAHLLARIIYALVTTGKPYDESCFARGEEAQQKRQQARLFKTAAALGFTLTPMAPQP